MKKIVCILVLSCTIMGAAFAQQRQTAAAARGKEPKNCITFMDLYPLFSGLIASDFQNEIAIISLSFAYERSVAPHFSVGPDLDMVFIGYPGINDEGKEVNKLDFYLGLAAELRYYPNANFDKFFVGTTLGFDLCSVDGKIKPKDGRGWFSLTSSIKMGYKFLLGKTLFLEPSVGLFASKASEAAPLGLGSTMRGGLRFGIAF